jgi:hypothetical protein
MPSVSLAELIAPARRVALVGLAKNTGKTETLGAILRELEALGRVVGVTSTGRDGEARDAIDVRIEKPRLRLAAGSLVASTDALLRASGLPHDVVQETGIRTPLGRVSVVRLQAGGAVEVAGPSAAADVRAVADAMLAAGAEQVLVDGAIDRRAASSPAVCDGLVLCTGAVLHRELDRVVALTRDAVELVRLPLLEDVTVRAVAAGSSGSLLVAPAGREPVRLPPGLLLNGTAAQVTEVLGSAPTATHLVLHGALCDPFLGALIEASRGRPPAVVVADGTRVFPGMRGYRWYRRRGLDVRVLESLRLCAVTVNPVAPQSHRFSSAALSAAIETALPGAAVVDVRSPTCSCAPST